MKIILFIDSLAGGGAQRQLVNLAIGLTDRNHTVKVISYFNIDDHLERLNDAGISHHCLKKQGRWDIAPVFKLHEQVRIIKPQVVIAFLRTPSFYAELVKIISPRTPLIVSERIGVEKNGLSMRDYVAATGHLAATHLTANSHDYLDRVTTKVPFLARKSTVIYNGVDSEFTMIGTKRVSTIDKQATEQKRAETANNLSTKACIRFCVVAARTTPQKGLIPLVKAVQLLADSETYPFTIDWIGPVQSNAPEVVEANNRLATSSMNACWRWVGPVRDIKSVYDNYDALILPSLFEGVANSMCEAMSCALPVIATDIADNRLILENGKTGFLCKPNDPEELASAMREFLQLSLNERADMAKSSFHRAEKLFSMSQFIDQWELLCQSVKSSDPTKHNS